jgi:hypothetical protein
MVCVDPWNLDTRFSSFFPQPHLFEKLHMLINGELSRGIDVFDLFLHGAFPLLLIVKAALSLNHFQNKP